MPPSLFLRHDPLIKTIYAIVQKGAKAASRTEIHIELASVHLRRDVDDCVDAPVNAPPPVVPSMPQDGQKSLHSRIRTGSRATLLPSEEGTSV